MDRCVLSINLRNLTKNYETLSKYGNITAVLKDNAYGLGAKEVTKILEKCGCRHYAVATVYEGREIRKYTSGEIVVLGFVENWNYIKKYNLTPLAYDEYSLKVIKNANVKYYVKVNSGMNRLGFTSLEEVLDDGNILGYMSHFFCADGEDELSKECTKAQYERFLEVVNSRGKKIISNSAGLLSGYVLDGARVGIALYGIENRKDLLPVCTLKSRVIAIRNVKGGEYIGYSFGYKSQRDMRIAVVSIGYADGLKRGLSNKLIAKINGEYVQSVGNISMDSSTFDITGKHINLFDEVTIFDDYASLQNIATQLNTIPYDIISGISPRVKRRYIEEV